MKISIIIPAYNCDKFLSPLLKKLEEQMNKQVELIVVNDGSTDNTINLLKEFKKKSTKNITIINKENGGVSSARNAGLDIATGEYVDFIDSDDDIKSDYISRLLEATKEGKDLYKKSWESFGAFNGTYYARSLPDWNCSCWSRFWKKDIIKHKFDVNLKTCEDAKFLAENVTPDLSVGYIDEPIYRYFSGREGSLCNPIKKKVMLYFPHLNRIGGVEDQMLKWCKRYSDIYDITIGYSLANTSEHTIEKLKKYAKVELQGEEINADVFIDCTTYLSVPRKVNANKIILWQHCLPNLFAWSIFNDKEYMSRVSSIVSVSKTVQRLIKEKGYESTVIYNDFDTEEIRRLANEFETPKYDFCYVGRFGYEKGLPRIAKMARIKRTKKFVLVGKNGKDLTMLVNSIGLPNVDIIEATDNPFPYIKNSKFSLLLSNFESWGNSITESLILGVPVITTDFEASYEQIQNGINGFIIKPNLNGLSNIKELDIKPLDYKSNWEEWRDIIER